MHVSIPPTRGLFLTCTRGIFFFYILFYIIIIQGMHEFSIRKKKASLTILALCIWQRIPILAGPLL
jgi:hypothetical protein